MTAHLPATLGILAAFGLPSAPVAWPGEDSVEVEQPAPRVLPDWLELRGRLMFDGALFAADSLERSSPWTFDSGAEVRRARLGAQGTLPDQVRYRLELEFSTDETELRDAWVQVGPLRIGHFREPLGLEAHTAAPYLTLLERSLATSSFTPGRNLGITWSGSPSEDVAFTIGAFLEADDHGEAAGGDGALTARLHGLVRESEARNARVHLGIAASLRRAREEGVRFSSRPEAHLAPRLVDTQPQLTDRALVLGIEGAWQDGPFSMQAELFTAQVEAAGDDPSLWGGYAQASLFPTGESRGWRRARGSFGGPVEAGGQPLAGEAWELAARISRADLDDAAITGGRTTTLALGATWYASSHTRLMFNWIHAAPSGFEESAELFLARFQIIF